MVCELDGSSITPLMYNSLVHYIKEQGDTKLLTVKDIDMLIRNHSNRAIRVSKYIYMYMSKLYTSSNCVHVRFICLDEPENHIAKLLSNLERLINTFDLEYFNSHKITSDTVIEGVRLYIKTLLASFQELNNTVCIGKKTNLGRTLSNTTFMNLNIKSKHRCAFNSIEYTLNYTHTNRDPDRFDNDLGITIYNIRALCYLYLAQKLTNNTDKYIPLLPNNNSAILGYDEYTDKYSVAITDICQKTVNNKPVLYIGMSSDSRKCNGKSDVDTVLDIQLNSYSVLKYINKLDILKTVKIVKFCLKDDIFVVGYTEKRGTRITRFAFKNKELVRSAYVDSIYKMYL